MPLPVVIFEGARKGYRAINPQDRHGRYSMTIIEVKLLRQVFTARQKKDIAAKLAEAMASVSLEQNRADIWVLINEVRSGDSALGGERLRAAMLKRLVTTECAMFAIQRRHARLKNR
jgi:4-oxalocrotonate tautomerase family enzyme